MDHGNWSGADERDDLLLKRMGHDVDVAENGVQALRAWHDKEYDLILKDMQMPEMGGAEATSKIREDQEPDLMSSESGNGETPKPQSNSPAPESAGNSPESGQGDFEFIDLEFARSVMGCDDQEVLLAIAEALQEECPQRIAELDQALQEQNADGVMRAAHTLKGAVSVFGAKSIVETVFEIERLGRGEDLSQVPELLPVLKDKTAKLVKELETLRASGGA